MIVPAVDADARRMMRVLSSLALILGLGALTLLAWLVAAGASMNPESWIYLPVGLVLLIAGGYGLTTRAWFEIDDGEVRRVVSRFGSRRVEVVPVSEIVRVETRGRMLVLVLASTSWHLAASPEEAARITAKLRHDESAHRAGPGRERASGPRTEGPGEVSR